MYIFTNKCIMYVGMYVYCIMYNVINKVELFFKEIKYF